MLLILPSFQHTVLQYLPTNISCSFVQVLSHITAFFFSVFGLCLVCIGAGIVMFSFVVSCVPFENSTGSFPYKQFIIHPRNSQHTHTGIYIYIYRYVYIYMCCVHTHIYIYCNSLSVSVSPYIYIYKYGSLPLSLYIYIYKNTTVYIYIYVYISSFPHLYPLLGWLGIPSSYSFRWI